MDFSVKELDEDLAAFAAEVDEFIENTITEKHYELERQLGDGYYEDIHMALGAKGWIMPGWPVERGGAALSPLQQRILELKLEDPRLPHVLTGTTRLVTGAVEKFAVPEVANEILPKVAAGTARFCLGYTEPDGGSDIANAKTRAVQDGDEWIINGAKVFTTGAHNATHTFLITRTDTQALKHKGMTMFLVPLDTPGILIGAIATISGERTNAVYYTDVRIPDKWRLGAVNQGWSVLHGPLDEEHSIGLDDLDGLADLSVGVGFANELEAALAEAVEWATTEVLADGTHPIDDGAVRARLGKVAVDIELARCAPGPIGRVAGSETLIRGAADLTDLVGPRALIPHGQPGCLGEGILEWAHRRAQVTAIFGGTTDVFRNIIAQHVLGLPKLTFPGSKTFLTGRAPATAA